MAILPRLRMRAARALTKGLVINRLQSLSSSATIHYTGKVGDGTECDVIMIPVLWAARRMAETPIGVRKIDDNDIDFAHPLATLLESPCPWYSGSALRIAHTVEWMVDGNAYAYKIRGKHDEVVAEQFIPHWAIEPHTPNDGWIDYYEYWPTGLTSKTAGMIKILPKDLVHLRNGIDPNNPRKGISPLKILLREVYTDVEASEFTAMLLKNAGVMGVIIAPKDSGGSMVLPGESPETAKERYKQQWAGTRRGEPFVAAGPLDVSYVGVDAGKLDLSRLRDIPEERVSALLGLPAAVCGFGTGLQQTKVGATMVEMRAMAYEDCIIPMQNDWSSDWKMQLLPEFEPDPKKYAVAWDLSKVRVLQDDETKKSDRVMRQFAGGLITRKVGLDALGYESTPADEVLHLSFSTILVPKADADGKHPIGLLPEPEPDDDSDDTDPDAEPTPPKALPAPEGKAANSTVRFRRSLMDHEMRLSRRWTGELEKTFRALGDLVANEWEKQATRAGLGKAERAPTKVGQLDEYEQIARIVMDAVGPRIPGLEYGPQFLRVARDTVDLVNLVYGLGVNLPAPAEQRIISAGGRRAGLVDLNDQTKDSLFSALEQMRAEGMGPAQSAQLIRDMVPAGPWSSAEIRGEVIARTETKYAQNVSSLEAYKSSDTVTGVRVFDAQKGPTDEECEDINGQIVSFEEAEQLAESEHPNGTRSFAPYMGQV